MTKKANYKNQDSGESRGINSATLKNLKAHAQVNFPVNVWNVEQTFVNPGEEFVELIYTFPTAHGSILQNISVSLGEKHLVGVVVPAMDADDSYSDALADGDSAILIEKNEFGLHTMNIGNLGPGETCLIRFESATLLDAIEGQAKIIFPTVIDTRYGNASAQGGLGIHATPESNWLVEHPLELSVTLNGPASQCDVSSATHKIKVVQGSPLTINLGEISYLDRDFELTLGNLAAQYPGLVFKDPFSETEQYMSLSPFVWEQAEESDETHKKTTLKILIDCSGSMNGQRIEQAKKALHSLLATLNHDQQFTLSKFGDEVEHFFSRPVKAGKVSLKSAFEWIEALDANMGGTEMTEAIESISCLGESTTSDVFLITDGEIWDGQNLIKILSHNHIRLFVVAIGSSSNSNLLMTAAQTTGGHAEVPHSDMHIEQAALRLHKRIGTPRATILSFTVDEQRCIWHEASRPIFKDQTIHAFSIHPNLGTKSTLGICFGEIRDEKKLKLNAILIEIHDQLLRETLARLCITKALQEFETNLGEQISALVCVGTLEQPEIKETDLEKLAVRYQLITDRTKYLLVDQRDNKANDLPVPVSVRQMRAKSQLDQVLPSKMAFFSRSATSKSNSLNDSLSPPALFRLKRDDRSLKTIRTWDTLNEFPASLIELLVVKFKFNLQLRRAFEIYTATLKGPLNPPEQFFYVSPDMQELLDNLPAPLLAWAKSESSNTYEMLCAIDSIITLVNKKMNDEFICHTMFPRDTLIRRLAQALGFINVGDANGR